MNYKTKGSELLSHSYDIELKERVAENYTIDQQKTRITKLLDTVFKTKGEMN